MKNLKRNFNSRDENELNYEWKYRIPEPGKRQCYKGKVILYYGPYEVLHCMRHFPNKLRGLKDLLVKEGYKVLCVPWHVYNRMGVSVNGNLIYTCNYKYMDFDGFGQDSSTKEAFEITVNALNRINGWYLLSNFKKNDPMSFYSTTIGK